MKLNTNLRVVENNSFGTKDFTIQASGKMFHMVISGLYSNKPQSITREIWSNAFDAHAMVGKEDQPFQVSFPTSLTPVFSCRDFGPGIAHEDMEGFYTVLGHSTKENTNRAVGKWGVGRMSPMSYTDTFSVTSYHKGKVAYYSVQLGADGSPQLHVLAPPMDTTEPDGLEVSFPVKRQDVYDFQRAAEVVSYGFPVAPIVTNSKEKNFTPIKKIFEGKGYYYYDDSRMSGSYAQMGCVLYPIDRRLSHVNIVYQFDIGELEVTASREALSYGPNDPTEDNIKKRIAEVQKILVEDFQNRINSLPGLFDAAKEVPQLQKYIPHGQRLTYKGVDIPRFWVLPFVNKAAVCVGYRGYNSKTIGWTTDLKFEPSKPIKLFVQDTSDKKGNARATTRIASVVGSYEHYIWIKADLKDKEHQADIKKIVDQTDLPVVYVKDIPDPGARKVVRRPVQVSTLINGNKYPYEMSDEEFQKGGHYVPISNNEVPYWAIAASHFPLSSLIGCSKVVLVPKTLWKKFEGTNWKLLEPLVKNFVDSNKDQVYERFNNEYGRYPFYKLKQLSSCTGPVGIFAGKVKAEATEYLSVKKSHWSDLLAVFGLPRFSQDKVDQEYSKLLADYPLLRYIDDNNVGEMKTYVDLKYTAMKKGN